MKRLKSFLKFFIIGTVNDLCYSAWTLMVAEKKLMPAFIWAMAIGISNCILISGIAKGATKLDMAAFILGLGIGTIIVIWFAL